MFCQAHARVFSPSTGLIQYEQRGLHLSVRTNFQDDWLMQLQYFNIFWIFIESWLKFIHFVQLIITMKMNTRGVLQKHFHSSSHLRHLSVKMYFSVSVLHLCWAANLAKLFLKLSCRISFRKGLHCRFCVTYLTFRWMVNYEAVLSLV